MIDFIFFAVFLASGGALTFFISRKVPILAAVPERVLEESFSVNQPKLSAWWSAIRLFANRVRIEGIVVSLLEKALRRIRMWFLKGDAMVSRMLTRLQERSRALSEQKPRYLQGLKAWKRTEKYAGTTPEILPPISSPARNLDGVQRLFQPKEEEIPPK